MVKLKKPFAPKKLEESTLQKPLKAKKKKDGLNGKEAKLIKETVKPELIKEVAPPQNGKAAKKNKAKKVPEKPTPKEDSAPVKKTKAQKVPEKAAPKEESAPLKKAKAEKVPEKTVPAKKEKKALVAKEEVKSEAPVKKPKKTKKPVEDEVPVPKKIKKVAQAEPLVKAPEQSKKGKKGAKAAESEPIEDVQVKPEGKKGKKAAKNQEPAKVEPVKPQAKKEKNAPKATEKPVPEARKKKKGKNPVQSVEEIPNEKSDEVFEAPPFDEENFNNILCFDNIEKIVKGLIKTVKKETENKKEIFSDYRYILDVSCHKIANCPKRMVKLSLKHPIAKQTEDDVVLFVSDLQRGKKVDFEPTIQHYEDLLQRNNIEGIKVIPFNQLKNEYSGFENKRKLANSYEHFLCDGRIVSNVVGFLGSITQKPRTTLHAVRMNDHNNIAASIKKAICKTAFKQLNKGNMTSIPVASHRHTPEEVAENILLVLKQLKDVYPGGLANIRSLNIKVSLLGTSSLPLFISMAQGPETNPYVVGPREQKMLKLKRDTKDVLTKFQITKEGQVQRLTPEQIAQKRKILQAKSGEAVSEEVAAKKAKKEKKKKNKSQEEPKEEVAEEKEEEVEELIRLEDEDSEDEEGPVSLVKEGEEIEFDEDDDDDEDDDELEFEDSDDDDDDDDDDE